MQVYDMETSYLQDPSQCGNVLKGFEGFLSSSKNTALYGMPVLTLFPLFILVFCSLIYSLFFSLCKCFISHYVCLGFTKGKNMICRLRV